jgi:hypothetical protein
MIENLEKSLSEKEKIIIPLREYNFIKFDLQKFQKEYQKLLSFEFEYEKLIFYRNDGTWNNLKDQIINDSTIELLENKKNIL